MNMNEKPRQGSAEGASDLLSAGNHAAAGSAPGPAGQPGRVKTLEFPPGGDRRPFAVHRAVMIPQQPPGTKVSKNRQDKVIKTRQEEKTPPGGGSEEAGGRGSRNQPRSAQTHTRGNPLPLPPPASHAAAVAAPARPGGGPGALKNLEFPAGGDQRKNAARRAVNEV
jgi:hypothetical protein